LFAGERADGVGEMEEVECSHYHDTIHIPFVLMRPSQLRLGSFLPTSDEEKKDAKHTNQVFARS